MGCGIGHHYGLSNPAPYQPRIPRAPSRKTPQNARIRAFPENHYRRPNCQNTRANRSKTTPKIWVSFHFPPTGACVSADLPTETHGGRFIEGSKTGDFTRVFWPKSREICVFFHVEEGFQPPIHQQTLLGACRLRCYGIPRLRCLCITCIRAAPGTGNSHTIACAPRPPRGTGGARGGLRARRQARTYQPQVFPAIWIFVRKNPGVQTFARNFFGDFIFRTGEKPAGKISRQLFLQFSTFAPKIFRPGKFRGQKKYGLPDSMA